MPPAVLTPPRALTRADNGARMTLDDFENVEVAEGLRAELAQGVIQMSDVPDIEHALMARFIDRALGLYADAHQRQTIVVLRGHELKILIPETESERHPDLAVFLAKPPYGGQPWRDWVPELVVEVVSESSVERDYNDKPNDYWHAGVKEYVIADRYRRILQVHRRGATTWDVVTIVRGQAYTTPLLPDFSLDATALFEAAKV